MEHSLCPKVASMRHSHLLDDNNLIERVREGLTTRFRHSGMSLSDYLSELRKRLLYSGASLLFGFGVSYVFHVRL
jgi:hypothetical protein